MPGPCLHTAFTLSKVSGSSTCADCFPSYVAFTCRHRSGAHTSSNQRIAGHGLHDKRMWHTAGVTNLLAGMWGEQDPMSWHYHRSSSDLPLLPSAPLAAAYKSLPCESLWPFPAKLGNLCSLCWPHKAAPQKPLRGTAGSALRMTSHKRTWIWSFVTRL